VSTMRDSEIYTTVGKMNFFKWFIESKLWDKISTEGNDLSQLMALHPEHKYKKQLQRNSSRHKSPLLNFESPTFLRRISIRLSFFAIVGIRSPSVTVHFEIITRKPAKVLFSIYPCILEVDFIMIEP
jgi:hypothetical protein